MVKQFVFALGVTTCLVSIDTAHSKTTTTLFPEALEGSHPFQQKSVSLRAINSKQGWFFTSQTLGKNVVTKGTLFDLRKNNIGWTMSSLTKRSFFPFLNRPVSLDNRPSLDNFFSSSRAPHMFLVPQKSNQLQKLLTVSSTPRRKVTNLPFFTRAKAPTTQQLLLNNITISARKNAFLSQKKSIPLQKPFPGHSLQTHLRNSSESLPLFFLSRPRTPGMNLPSRRDILSSSKNESLVLRRSTQTQTFTPPSLKDSLEEPMMSLKKAFSQISIDAKPPVRSSVPLEGSPLLPSDSSSDVSLASVIKNLVSTTPSSKVEQGKPVMSSPSEETNEKSTASQQRKDTSSLFLTSPLRGESPERKTGSIILDNSSASSYKEDTSLQSIREGVMRSSFSLASSSSLEQEGRSSYLAVEENSTLLSSRFYLPPSLLKKEQVAEKTIQSIPLVSSILHFSSQSDDKERSESPLSKQNSASLTLLQEQDPISETRPHPLNNDSLIEPTFLVAKPTIRDTAPVIVPALDTEEDEIGVLSALLKDGTEQSSQEQQRLKEQQERERLEKREGERIEEQRLKKLEWARNEQLEWERIEAQLLKEREERKRVETQRLEEQRLKEQQERERLEKELLEKLERERIEAQRLEEQRERERIEAQRLEEQRIREQRERERIEAQRLEEQRILEQRVEEALKEFVIVADQPVEHHNPPVFIDNYLPVHHDAPPLVLQQPQQQARGGVFGFGWTVGGYGF